MKKLSLVLSALALALAGANAQAAPGGFDASSQVNVGGPQGFANNNFNTVRAVLDNARDDQYVTLTGRLTNYLGHDRYEFTDNTGTIEVELDDDKNWSHISKGQLIVINGEVDKDFMSIKIDVKSAQPAQQ